MTDIQLSMFDMSTIRHDSVCAIFGGRGVGKTTLIKDIVKKNQVNETDSSGVPLFKHKLTIDPLQIITGTVLTNNSNEYNFKNSDEDNNLKKFDTFMSLRKYDRDQNIRNNTPNEKSCIVFDNCNYTPFLKSEWFNKLFLEGRLYRIFAVLVFQYPCLPPVLRRNVGYSFHFYTTDSSIRRRQFNDYGGIIPTFELYCMLLDMCKDGYNCLVINHNVHSTELQKCIFWYKAELHPDFEFVTSEMVTNTTENTN